MNADGSKTGGRQKGTPNKATAEVRALASEYGPAAIKELATLAGVVAGATPAQSETARISAIGMLIERGYGRSLAGRSIQIDLPDTATPQGVADALDRVIQATACGDLTPGEANDFCSILNSKRRAIELADIEVRLAKLEAERSDYR